MKALIALIAGFALLVFALWIGGYHFVWKPTADELYGCTVEQRAPNGECQ